MKENIKELAGRIRTALWSSHTQQLMKYVLVGLASNGTLYIGYLALVSLHVGHKTAMSIAYAAGVAITFLGNRNWTFSHTGKVSVAAARHLIAYAAGYVLQWTLLYVFIDMLGLPHWLVQGASILVVATFLFSLQRFWVFRA